MRSIQLLAYKAEEGTLEGRARDFKPHWMTAVAALDDDVYLGAENSYNLFALRKNGDAAADEDRSRLEARAPCLIAHTSHAFNHCLQELVQEARTLFRKRHFSSALCLVGKCCRRRAEFCPCMPCVDTQRCPVPVWQKLLQECRLACSARRRWGSSTWATS
jgi:hypothetical protein